MPDPFRILIIEDDPEHAELIKMGKAYVCCLSPEEMREYRGTLTEPGKELLVVPGTTSATSTVPASVPSLFHNSEP